MKSLQPIVLFQEIIKGACGGGGLFFPSALTDCVFVRLTVAPFAAGINRLQGATRSDWESWGGGTKQGRSARRRVWIHFHALKRTLGCLFVFFGGGAFGQ